MSNSLTLTLEVKAAPELMLALNSLITVMQPKDGTYSAPKALTQATAPASMPAPQMQYAAPVQTSQQQPPIAIVQQYMPQVPPYAAPVAPQAPQYTAPVQQAPVNPTQAMPANNMASPANPAATPDAPTSFPSNPAPTATPGSVAPTAQAPAFTYDDLANAASSLMDQGKQQQLIALLGQFHIQRLDLLPKEQNGAFATALRQMGARI